VQRNSCARKRGKGFITAKLAERLHAWNVAAISADDWLNLPDVCINRDNYAEHFYEHAMRFDEMFEQLVVPLRQNREINLTANCADAKAQPIASSATSFEKSISFCWKGFSYTNRHIDIISILPCGIDCSFGTALERATNRCQEGLPPAETIKAFETIYFPAQRIHLVRDNPREAADIVLTND
jgi:uridine kinase